MPVMYVHPCQQPTPELVKHVTTYLAKRDSAWAWNLINRTGGRDAWPPRVVALVEQQAQAEQEDV